MNTTANDKRHITRNRASYSCQTCRRRKVKCDKVHPVCGGCRKTNENCVYGQEDHNRLENEEISSNGPFVGGLKRKKSDFQSDARDVTDSDQPYRWIPNHTSKLRALEEQIERLSTLVESMRENDPSHSIPKDILTPISSRSLKDSDEEHQSQEQRLSPSSSENEHPHMEVTDLGRPLSKLSLTPQVHDASRGHSDVFWSAIFDEVDNLNLLLKGAGKYISSTSIANVSCKNHDVTPSKRSLFLSDKTTASNEHHHQGSRQDHSKQSKTATEDCDLCVSAASEKAIFLCGPDSKLLLPNHRLDLLDGLPGEEQSNVLFRCWLSGFNPVISLGPLQDLFLRYQAFWQWHRNFTKHQNSEVQSPDMLFMPLFYAVLYSGSLSISLPGLRRWFPNTSRRKLSTNLHRQVVRYLSFISFPSHASLPPLAAFIILQSASLTEETLLQTNSYINLILTLAQTQGLHREPTNLGLPPFESEMRRRLWWHILCIDTSFAVSSGHPTQFSDEFHDTRMVNEVKVAKLGLSEALKYEENVGSGSRVPDTADEPLMVNDKTMVSVPSMMGKAMAITAHVLRKVLKIHLGTGPLTRDSMTDLYKMLDDMGKEMTCIINRIPTRGLPESDFTPDLPDLRRISNADCDNILGTPPELAEILSYMGMSKAELEPSLAQYHRQKIAAFHKYARVSLSLMKDKVHCVAYAPFLKNAKSKLWSSARQCGLHHCHAFMRKFISLAADPSFMPFRWTWSRMHQPLHAALIILVDVHERPHSVEAPRSRSLIDQVFALSDPNIGMIGGDDGVSPQLPLKEGGPEAWNMLRGLRDRAWRIAKLDPGVLWTEEDQIRAGVAKPLTEEQKIAQSIREDRIYEKNDNTSAHTSGTAISGVKYAVDLAKDELASRHHASNTEYSKSTKDQLPPKGLENFQGTRLARFDGQQFMPFPYEDSPTTTVPIKATTSTNDRQSGLGGELPQVQVGNEANLGVYHLMFPHHALTTSNNNSSRNLKSQTTKSLNTSQKSNNEGLNPIESSDLYNIISKQAQARREWHDPSNIVDDEIQNQNQNQDFNGTHPNIDIDHGIKMNGLNHHDDQNPPETQSESNKKEQINNQVNIDVDFDWDKWDAVFGQYSGFTDLMEDVTWEFDD